MKNDGVTITLLAAGALAAGAAMVRLGSAAQKEKQEARSLVMKRILAFQERDRNTILRTLESMGLGVVVLSQYYTAEESRAEYFERYRGQIPKDLALLTDPERLRLEWWYFGSGWTKEQLAEWASEVEHDDVIRMLPWLKVVMERGELRSFSTGLGPNPVDNGMDYSIGPKVYPMDGDRFVTDRYTGGRGNAERGVRLVTRSRSAACPELDAACAGVFAIDEWEKRNGSMGIIPFLQEVTDWAVATRPKALFSMTYRQAAEAAYQWHQDLRTRKRKVLSDVGMYVVWRWSDGWFVTKIDSAQAVDAQGEQMDHCIADVFKSKILSKKTNAFSVRDPDCRPVVTIEVAKDGTVRQARGRGNSDPKPIYASYTLDFLKKSGLADLTKASSDLALVRKNASPIRSTGRQVDETVTCSVRIEDLVKTQRVLQAFPYSPSALQALDTTLRSIITFW